ALDELTLAETAYLAVLPKAPNNYQVEDHAVEAKARRDWILLRMFEDDHISKKEYDAAILEPLELNPQKISYEVDGRYFNEDIRRELATRYGENALYEGGLSVRSTMDPDYQAIAAKALTDGLVRYDRQYGYRGPVKNIAPLDEWK